MQPDSASLSLWEWVNKTQAGGGGQWELVEAGGWHSPRTAEGELLGPAESGLMSCDV